MAEPTPPPESPSLVSDAFRMFALCGFAVAQPLFDLLGDNPSFFVAHDMEGFDVVLFALALLAIPALAAFVILLGARLVSDQIARFVRLALTGVLISLIVTPVLDDIVGLSTASWIVISLLLAVAVAFAYDRLRHLRTFVTYLAPAPLLFLVVFVFISPAEGLIFSVDPATAAVDLHGTRTNVVTVVFDEFPLGAIIDERGRIDAARFPGFNRLARLSTWYPRATPISSWTHLAVPGILTGSRPLDRPIPSAGTHPRSLFTLFGRSHALHVSEAFTQLCPASLCDVAPTHDATEQLSSDVQAVFLRSVLPESTATDWGVPKTDQSWGEFDEKVTPLPTNEGSDQTADQFQSSAVERVRAQNQLQRFEDFIGSLEASTDPGLWFHHSILPHVPYEWLPDGRPYADLEGASSAHGLGWPDDEGLVQVAAMRFMLQAQLADRLLSQMLDRLESQQMLDDTMLVVMADHGVSFTPGKGLRLFDTQVERDGVLAIPLFVKYPGQRTGKVDDRDASEIDVLPTIVDTLGVRRPPGWKFDGRSLVDPPERRPLQIVTKDSSELRTIDADIDPRRFSSFLRSFLYDNGDVHDPYRVGPYGPLVGQQVSQLPLGEPRGTFVAPTWAAYDSVDLEGVIPAVFDATVTGVDLDRWVAIAVNGSIAGVGPVYQNSLNYIDGIAVMLDPSFLRNGKNTIAMYAIDPDGRTLHPLERRE